MQLAIQWSNAPTNKVCPPVGHTTYCPMKDFVVIYKLAIRQLHYNAQFSQSVEMHSSEVQLYFPPTYDCESVR